MPETLQPIVFTASSSSFWRRPVMKTYAPSLTKSFAVANPIPSVPPVMTATLPSSLLGIVFPCSCRVLMGVEPLPNIRDGILVERLVMTMRYVADMRRREYVVEGPEGMRRRQRLNVEYVDSRAGDLLVLQHADQSLLFDDRPARRVDQPGRWFHSLQLRGPTRPRVRLLNTKWIVRISARSNSWPLETRIAPAALAASGVMFWLQAIKFIPKALPTRATCDPIRPSPRTPRVFPRRSVPTVCCQPPERTELLSVTICRAEAKMSAQVNSIVGSDLYPV